MRAASGNFWAIGLSTVEDSGNSENAAAEVRPAPGFAAGLLWMIASSRLAASHPGTTRRFGRYHEAEAQSAVHR
jgi:hypothetical protein